MITRRLPTVRIYHTTLWAKYKGAVFSELHSLSERMGLAVSFVQVAETELERGRLACVDLSYHNYPYRVLFGGPYDHVPVHRLTLATALDVLRNKTDLVVLPGYHRLEHWAMLLVCIVLRRRRAVFCDSTGYEHRKKFFKEMAKRMFFRHCDGFFCYGVRSKEYVESYVGKRGAIFYRCQAAALPHEYDPQAVLRHHRSHPSRMHEPRFIYVGRMAEEKGLFDLLEALRQVRAQLAGARLTIVGSGPLADPLVAQARALGLESAVDHLGTKTPGEIGRLLMASTALVLPSHREPWGLVVNEALSYGCPVVVSHVCGCVPELVIDGITGYSYPAGDTQALSSAMIAVVRMCADRPALARTCLEAVASYTPRDAASEILRGCSVLLTNPRAPPAPHRDSSRRVHR